MADIIPVSSLYGFPQEPYVVVHANKTPIDVSAYAPKDPTRRFPSPTVFTSLEEAVDTACDLAQQEAIDAIYIIENKMMCA